MRLFNAALLCLSCAGANGLSIAFLCIDLFFIVGGILFLLQRQNVLLFTWFGARYLAKNI